MAIEQLGVGVILECFWRRGSVASQGSRLRIGTSVLLLISSASQYKLLVPSALHFLHLENAMNGIF